MKFLIIDGKLVRMRNGDFITVPDNYNNEPLTINGKLLTVGGAIAGKNFTGEVQLATPQNVIAYGTVVSWDEVENATSYEVLADGNEIGTVEQTIGYNLSITRGNKTGYSENLYGWINTQTGEFGEPLNNGNYENVYKVICYSGGGGPVQILSYTGQITINGSDVQLNYDYYGDMTIELSSDATFIYVASD